MGGATRRARYVVASRPKRQKSKTKKECKRKSI